MRRAGRRQACLYTKDGGRRLGLGRKDAADAKQQASQERMNRNGGHVHLKTLSCGANIEIGTET